MLSMFPLVFSLNIAPIYTAIDVDLLLSAVVEVIPVPRWYDVIHPAPLIAGGRERFKPVENNLSETE